MSQRDLVHGVAQQHDGVVVERKTPVVFDAGGPPHQQGVAKPDDQPVHRVTWLLDWTLHMWNDVWNVSQTVIFIILLRMPKTVYKGAGQSKKLKLIGKTVI